MKKLTTELMALIVCCLMSVGAMAQDVNISASTTKTAINGTAVTFDNGNVSFINESNTIGVSGTCWTASSNPAYLVISTLNGKLIDKVEIDVTANNSTAGKYGIGAMSEEGTTWMAGQIFELPNSTIATDAVTYTFTAPSSSDITICKFGRASSGTSLGGASIPSGAGGATVRIWAVRIWYKAATITTPIIQSFTVAGIEADIDQEKSTITAELPYGTNLTALEPTVVIGGTATGYSPVGAVDFTSPVIYTVTDGTSAKGYTVTLITQEAASTDATLADLKIDGTTIAGFDAATYTYDYEIAYAVTQIPQITAIQNDATAQDPVVVQASEIPGKATVTVTAQSGATQLYEVNFTRKAAATANLITSFRITGQKGVTLIDDEANTITVNMLIGTDITQLTPAITISNLATIDSTGTQDFTSPVQYTVTSESGDAKIYTVSIELIAQAYLEVLPYATDIPADFIIPAWMEGSLQGLIFNGAYSGSDATALGSGANVLRIGANERLVMFLSECGTVTVECSATGGRTFKLYINDVEVNTAEKGGAKDTKYTIEHSVNSTNPVVVSIENIGTGGATIGSISITAASTESTNLNKTTLQGIVYANGIIRNENRTVLHLYNISGKLITTSNHDIDMNSFATGVYIVRTTTGVLKIVK